MMAKKTNFHERVGMKIKELREKCGAAVVELSESSGLSEDTLKLIESGKRDIKVSELFQISKALNIRIASFLNPCDYKYYERKKEEKIEYFISLHS